ncbi:MAG TPA: RecX family transcriptional regulator [Chloroflexota bacterium]|nr:RecX family transcriptional regulator [Chloroflexota bacterium]
MPTVTAIEPQQHDAERVNVYLDGKFAFGTSLLLAVSHHLVTGKELSPSEVDELRHDDVIDRTAGAALNFLSFRPRSRREIEQYLRRKGVEPPVAAEVMARLERLGLIDDREFARFWVENRQTFRPRGARALKAEMRQKGLDGEVIEDVLETLPDEVETAYRAGEKKARSLRNEDEREFLRKLLGFLQRRGFPYGVAVEAAKQLRAEMTQQDLETDLTGE